MRKIRTLFWLVLLAGMQAGTGGAAGLGARGHEKAPPGGAGLVLCYLVSNNLIYLVNGPAIIFTIAYMIKLIATGKALLAFPVLAFFALYATHKGLQTLAAAALILLIMLLYKSQTIALRDLLFKAITNAKQAKLGSLEVQLNDKTLIVLSEVKKEKLSILSQIMLATLSSDEVGILAEITRVDRYSYKGPLLETLRRLRDKGLIAYDAPGLASSPEVWATDTGKQLIIELKI